MLFLISWYKWIRSQSNGKSLRAAQKKKKIAQSNFVLSFFVLFLLSDMNGSAVSGTVKRRLRAARARTKKKKHPKD